MSFAQAQIKDALRRIEAKVDQLLSVTPDENKNVVSGQQELQRIEKEETMTPAQERMAKARSMRGKK